MGDDAQARLIAAATEARTRARCEHSGFAVGVALRDQAGNTFTGANVESASYPLGLCAERVALFHAVTHGAGDIVEIAIVTGAREPTAPCGGCRQVMWERAPGASVVMATTDGQVRRTTVAALLPEPFDATSLESDDP